MLFPMCKAAYCVGLDFSTLVRFGSVFNLKYSVSFFLLSVFAHHHNARVTESIYLVVNSQHPS